MNQNPENQFQPPIEKERTIQDVVKDLESYIRLAGLIMAIIFFLYGAFQMVRVSTVISKNERLGLVNPNTTDPSSGTLYGAMITNGAGPFSYIKNFFEMRKIQNGVQNDFNEVSNQLNNNYKK